MTSLLTAHTPAPELRATPPIAGAPIVAEQAELFDPRPGRPPATIEIVIPVYNEEADLGPSVRRLHRYLAEHFPLDATITIADNASTDRTWPLARALAAELDGVRAAHLPAKGRGRALRAVWSASRSPVVAYMDVDLSTDLDALLPLVAPLVSGHSDLAIGSRLARTARVRRGPRREVISRSYNLLLRAALNAGFSDAQCGFKAARSDALAGLLPLVADQGWFFDTELLVLAEHNGLRIHEVPVDWVDDPDSRVDVVATARADLAGVWRLLRSFARGGGELARRVPDTASVGAIDVPFGEQLVRFASIAVVSTLAFAALFVLLAGPLGSLWADIAALGLCTLANTTAHRRLTFALAGRAGRAGHHARGLIAALVPLALNLATLAGLAALAPSAARGVALPLAALTVANGVAGLAKLTLLRRWVFRPAGRR